MNIVEEIKKRVDDEIHEIAKRVVKEELRMIWGKGPAEKCFQDQKRADDLIRRCQRYS